MFHESDRAQIAVICRHKLHDRIIGQKRKRSRARRNRRESAEIPERASESLRAARIIAFTEL